MAEALTLKARHRDTPMCWWIGRVDGLDVLDSLGWNENDKGKDWGGFVRAGPKQVHHFIMGKWLLRTMVTASWVFASASMLDHWRQCCSVGKIQGHSSFVFLEAEPAAEAFNKLMVNKYWDIKFMKWKNMCLLNYRVLAPRTPRPFFSSGWHGFRSMDRTLKIFRS